MAPFAGVDYQRMENGLQAVLGQHAAVSCCSTDGDVSSLTPIERSAIAGAIHRRQKEFSAGRAAAREAMRRLGRSASSIPMQHDRSPCWPADLVGSISHSSTTCISVVAIKSHWKSVGVDVEPDQDLPHDLWSLIGHPNELRRASAVPEAIRGRWMMRIFSAKEAYYKWVYPQTQQVLEFLDVDIELDTTLESTAFQVRARHHEANEDSLGSPSGRLMIDHGTIISLVIR
jgi:enterobactin synthetase component D